MRRTKEILRFESGLGLRQIARSLSISVGTVHDYLQRAEATGIKWPLPAAFDDSRLEAALFRQSTAVAPREAPPDFAAVRQQLQRPHVTLQLLWEEYQEAKDAFPGRARFRLTWKNDLISGPKNAACLLRRVKSVTSCRFNLFWFSVNMGQPLDQMGGGSALRAGIFKALGSIGGIWLLKTRWANWYKA
jgi:hypothetical protein